MDTEVYFQQQDEQIWIMVWILRGLTINLVIVFLDLAHLPLFVIGILKNEKEVELGELI